MPRSSPGRWSADQEALRYQMDLQETITALSTEFINLAADEIDDAVTRALERVGVLAGVDRSYVFLIAPDGERMSNTQEWARPGVTPQIENLQDIPVASYDWCMSRILSGEMAHIPQVRALRDDQPDKLLLMAEGIQSLLAVPIVSRGAVIGLIGFDAVESERQWSEDTIALLKVVGSIFGNAIVRSRFEQALRHESEFVTSIIETSANLVLVLDPRGVCVRVNKAFTEMTGLSAERLNEVRWMHVIPSDGHDVVRKALREATSGASSHVPFESGLTDQTGERRSMLWNASVIRASNGSPSFIVITGVDVTEVRALQQQLEQSKRLDSLGRVAAIIAHEFNNVLMAIQPFADVIRRSPDHRKVVEDAAERIAQAVKRGAAITEQVTRFARPAEPVRQRIEVTSWTRGLIDEMRPVIARRTNSPVEIDVAPSGSSAEVFADPTQLQQVFSNLLINAADAIPAGGRITVGVTSERGAELVTMGEAVPASWLHWRVSDTGAGIPPALLDRIFEPLFTTKKRGTGLGLAVVHQVVKAHGGTMSVESALGQGTTFHVLLPEAPAVATG